MFSTLIRFQYKLLPPTLRVYPGSVEVEFPRNLCLKERTATWQKTNTTQQLCQSVFWLLFSRIRYDGIIW